MPFVADAPAGHDRPAVPSFALFSLDVVLKPPLIGLACLKALHVEPGMFLQHLLARSDDRQGFHVARVVWVGKRSQAEAVLWPGFPVE